MLFPNKVTFTDSGDEDIDISLGEGASSNLLQVLIKQLLLNFSKI